MYAIVRVGNKQYRVEKGDTLLVDRMPGDEGSKIELEPLLYRSDDVVFGSDASKVKVEAAVVGHERGKKIHGLKFKPKRGYKRRYGARADLTRIEIKDIKLLSRKPASSAKPAEDAAEEKPKPAAKKKAPATKASAAKKAPAKKASAAKKTAAKKAPAKKKEDSDGS